jgi:hypothetical protein
MDNIRDMRLMQFTSLLRTLNFISNARVTQCHHLFLKFEKENPLLDGYTRTDQVYDHTMMKDFINKLKEGTE